MVYSWPGCGTCWVCGRYIYGVCVAYVRVACVLFGVCVMHVCHVYCVGGYVWCSCGVCLACV